MKENIPSMPLSLVPKRPVGPFPGAPRVGSASPKPPECVKDYELVEVECELKVSSISDS